MLPLNSHKYFVKNLFLIAETLEVLLVFFYLLVMMWH